MGKQRRKQPQPYRPSSRIDTQALAQDLYERGLITRLAAHGHRTWHLGGRDE